MTDVPRAAIRFYGDTRFAFDVLENQQIALVRVTLLNDPFDPYGFFETEFGNYIDLFRYVRVNHPDALRWFRPHVTAQSWGKTERDLRRYMEGLRTNSFVCCTSAPTETMHPKDNLYMWGHYGNGHRGLAIEYDPDAVGAVVLNHHCSEGNAPLIGERPWAQMGYAPSFRAISAEEVYLFLKECNEVDARRKRQHDETPLDAYYQQLSVIKSDVWQAENEWRLMWRSTTASENVYKIPITQECVRAIYLGLAMPEEDKQRAIDAAAHHFPGTEVWCASKRHGNFSLDFARPAGPGR